MGGGAYVILDLDFYLDCGVGKDIIVLYLFMLLEDFM